MSILEYLRTLIKVKRNLISEAISTASKDLYSNEIRQRLHGQITAYNEVLKEIDQIEENLPIKGISDV